MRGLVLCITVAASAVFGITFAHAALYSPSEEQTMEAVSSTTSAPILVGNPEAPTRLIIPGIDVDANVQHVGRGQTGNMAVPSNYTDVGWYRAGALPGALGSAVIDGHVDNGFGLPAVFEDIKKLKPGDEIFTVSQDGKRLRFVVEDVDTYALQDVPLDTVFNRNDSARLNLITCSGAWEPEKKMYDERMVVYAKLET